MFIDELCHDVVWSHRRALVPMSRRTSAGDEARLYNDPNIPLHLPKRVKGATRSKRYVVCSEKCKQSKRANPAARDKDLLKRTKTVYWCKSCEVFLCIASGNEKCFELGLYHSKVQFWRWVSECMNGSRRQHFETVRYIVIERKKHFISMYLKRQFDISCYIVDYHSNA